MIGKLQGTIDYQGDDYIILMVGGVGYKVFTSELITDYRLPITKVKLWQ